MSFPFVQARRHGGAGNTPPTRVVIHGTVSPCVAGGALNIAKMFASTTRAASAHYVVDPGAIYQCLTEDTIGYHAPPNARSIGIELCDPQAGSSLRWLDSAHQAMLLRAARLARDICDRYDIPIVKLSAADLRAGKRGICGHVDVTNAWHQTTHVDPGDGFPWAQFIALVKASAPINQEDPLAGYTLDQIAEAIWSYKVPRPDNDPWPAGNQLGSANVWAWRAARAFDPVKIAAAVVAKIPPQTTVDEATLEAALRDVLGSLDGK